MNGQKNKKFLNSLSHKSGLKNLILTNIADHTALTSLKLTKKLSMKMRNIFLSMLQAIPDL